MKAVIIAGGFGTRLRPLSCTRPKHLFPIAGKPLLDWTMERLATSGIDEVIFAVNYLSEAFVAHYGKSAYGMRVKYCKERRPLGTGGCVKNAGNLIGNDESFLLLNGDILSRIDHTKLLAQHAKNGGVATVALHRVNDPSRYGAVEMTGKDLIKRFVEKPPHGKAPSNLINAGIYALSPEIYKYIPTGKRVSIERETFPALARDEKLFGYAFKGQWIDVGEPSDFLKGNRLLLDSELPTGHIAKSAQVSGQTQIINPVTIGEHAKIRARSRIGRHASLSQNVDVGVGVNVKNSIIFPGVVISDSSSVEGVIIGEDAFIGKNVKIHDHCLIGDHVVIHDGVVLASGVTVCPYKEVTESVRKLKRLM